MTIELEMSGSGERVVRGWAQCHGALSDSELVSDPFCAGLVPEPTNNLLLMEGERHRALRRLVTPHFSPRRVEGWRADLESTASALLGASLAKPEADLMADVAEPLVIEGLMSVLGVSDEHREELGELTRQMLGLLEPDLTSAARRKANRAALRATQLLDRERRAGRATGLQSKLDDAAADGVIPEKLARSTPVVVLHGGYENPLNQLGCLIAWAVEDPGRFRDAATAAPAALFDEILRVKSPVRRVARWTRGGELVWVDLESAHRDPERFASADVDLSSRQRNLGFGYGRHACPGSALARLEGEALIKALLTVEPDVLGAFSVEWREDVVARGPARIVRRPTTAQQ